MRFLAAFCRDCWTVVVPLEVLIIAVIALVLTGHGQLALVVSNAGTVLVMVANLVYVVAIHSRRRWPGASMRQRLVNVLTLTR